MFSDRFNDVKAHAPSQTAKIFEWYYVCAIQPCFARSIQDIRENGYIVTGIKDLDDAMKTDWVSTYLTINDMVEYFKRGVPFRIKDTKDTKDIYNAIHTHLAQWYELVRTGMNVRDAPLDDLIMMDKLAGLVYPYAKHFFTPEALESALLERLGEVQRLNVSNFFTRAIGGAMLPNVDATGKPKEQPIPERESFEDKFKKSALSLRSYD